MGQSGRNLGNARRVFGIWGLPTVFVLTIGTILVIERLCAHYFGYSYLSPGLYVESWLIISVLSIAYGAVWSFVTVVLLTLLRQFGWIWDWRVVCLSAISGWILLAASLGAYDMMIADSPYHENVVSRSPVLGFHLAAYLAIYIFPTALTTVFCCWRISASQAIQPAGK